MAEDKGLGLDNQTSIASLKESPQPMEMGDVEKEMANVTTEFVESPVMMREDQVKTAVSFLSHPKVRGSPIQYRRSFLEKKGLTKEEIDEAFRRVPDPSTSETSNVATISFPSVPASSSRQRIPPQPPTGVSGSPPAGLGTSSSQLTFPQQMQALPAGQQQLQYALQPVGPSAGQMIMAQPVHAPPSTSSKLHWAQVTLAVALLGAAGAGTAVIGQKVLFPKFQAWLRSVVRGEVGNEGGGDVGHALALKRTPAEEAALSAAAAAASIASAVQEMIKSRSDDAQRLDLMVKTMETQMQELRKTLMESLVAVKEATSAELRGELQSFVLGMSDDTPTQVPSIAGRQSIPVANIAKVPAVSSHTDFIQTIPASAPTQAPDLAAAYQMGRAIRGRSGTAPEIPKGGLSQAPHSASYLEVMDMLQRGEKPPNIREVNDKPPNPSQPPSNPQLAPRAKPWERSTTYAMNTVNPGLRTGTQSTSGSAHAGDIGAEWWRSKAPQGHIAAATNTFPSASPGNVNPYSGIPDGRSMAPPTNQAYTAAQDIMAPPQSSYPRPLSPVELSSMSAASSSSALENGQNQEESGRGNGGSIFESSTASASAVQRREDADMNADGSGSDSREAEELGMNRNGGVGSSWGVERPVGKAGWVPPPAPGMMLPGASTAMGYKGAEPPTLRASQSDEGALAIGANGKPVEGASSDQGKIVRETTNDLVEQNSGPAEAGVSGMETLMQTPSYKDASGMETLMQTPSYKDAAMVGALP